MGTKVNDNQPMGSGAADGLAQAQPQKSEDDSHSSPRARRISIENAPVELLLPLRLEATVVTGFQRGSKELGFPTANLNPDDVGKETFDSVETGVYHGFASVSGGEVHKAAISVGWNPQYHNKEKTIEAHILHDFGRDFYGEKIKLMITGYIRAMTAFPSIDDLIKAIENDCEVTRQELDSVKMKALRLDAFFT